MKNANKGVALVTTILGVQNAWQQHFYMRWDRSIAYWLVILAAVCGLLVAITNPALTEALSGLGSYISEKTLGSGATPDAMLTLGSGSGPAVLGAGPRITTGSASFSSDSKSATLAGTVNSLNGAPSITVWFEWGYSATALTHITAALAVAAPGAQEVTITGYDPNRIYYRMVASSDGTNYGDIANFSPGGGRGSGFYLLANILSLAMAFAILIVSIRLSNGNLIKGCVLIVIGLIFMEIVRLMLLSAW
jgi:hypothetical protein